MRRSLTCVLVVASLSIRANRCLGDSYRQLLATRYEQGETPPSFTARPARSFDFVDRARLPQGASVLSAARAASGRVWVVTDRGAFRSSGEGYEPLEVGPRRPEPGQPEVKPSAQVVEVVGDPVGHIWVATNRGLY